MRKSAACSASIRNLEEVRWGNKQAYSFLPCPSLYSEAAVVWSSSDDK